MLANSISRRQFMQTAAASASAVAAPAAKSTPPLVIQQVETFVVKGACLVKLTASNGAVGWGESDADNPPLMAAFIHNGLKQRVIGRDPWDSERIWDTMFFSNHDQGPGGALPNAIAGIDIALWDMKGQMLGLPVHQLLGGSYRRRIRVYGSFGVRGGRAMTADQAAAQAAKFVSRGLTAVKLRMQIRENNQNPEPDLTLVYARAVRRAIGPDVDLLVDINNGYTAARGIEISQRLRQELNVLMLEEPCSDQVHAETAAVVRALDMPVIAGEKEYTRWQLRELITMANPDFLNPDTIKAGGITEMKKIAAIAQAYGKPIICHNTRPTLGTAASLHFVASIPNCGPLMEFVDVDNFGELMSLMKNNVRYEAGYLYVPEGPGLGITVNEDKVRRAVIA